MPNPNVNGIIINYSTAGCDRPVLLTCATGQPADLWFALDCPAYTDGEQFLRCGLPTEVTRSYFAESTDGPIECIVIRCPVGHWFNGPIEFLTCHRIDRHDPASAPAAGHAQTKPAARP